MLSTTKRDATAAAHEIEALNGPGRKLLPELQAIAATAPPPGPLALRVTRIFSFGSKVQPRWFADGQFISISRSEIDQPWLRGTLAHEYAHFLNPAEHGLVDLVQPKARVIIPCAFLGGAIALSGRWMGWPLVVAGIALIVVALAVLARGWQPYAAASQQEEYRADALAAQLLGDRRVELLLMLEHQLQEPCRRKRPGHLAHLSTHPHPAQRLAAIAELDGERSLPE